jgi:hypothetical protein
LERLALIFVAVVAGIWATVMLLGMVAALPWGLPGLIALGAFGYLLWRVLRDRLSNAEDDYYEKNVKQ